MLPVPHTLREFLTPLSLCPNGKGIIVPPNPHPVSLEVFSECRAHGWVEEFRTGAARVWKITPKGRRAIQPPVPLIPFRQIIAEC